MTKGFAMDDERLTVCKQERWHRRLTTTQSWQNQRVLIARLLMQCCTSINEFLAFRKYDVLDGKGKISKKTADKKAAAEYDEFNKTQKINSDFDKQIKKMIEEGGEN